MLCFTSLLFVDLAFDSRLVTLSPRTVLSFLSPPLFIVEYAQFPHIHT